MTSYSETAKKATIIVKVAATIASLFVLSFSAYVIIYT